MFNSPSFPFVETAGVIEFGYIDSQGIGESVNEHVDDCLICQVVSSETSQPFEGADVIV